MTRFLCPLCSTVQKKKSYFGEYQRCDDCLRIIKLSEMKSLDTEISKEEETEEKEPLGGISNCRQQRMDISTGLMKKLG